MTVVMLLCNRYYHVPFIKLLLSAIMLTITGMLGGCLMYFIENGAWGNMSFYGAILFAPPMMYIVAKVIRADAIAILDMVAPTGCIFLAAQKINCLNAGCCAGIVLGHGQNGSIVRFPVQIVECAVALLICIFLYWLISNGKNRGKILPWFLVIYGTTRFGLNLLRETTPFLWGLAAGNVWSIVSVVLGVAMFVVIRIRKGK